MSRINWTDEAFTVHVPIIDQQHQRLIALINRLEDLIEASEFERLDEVFLDLIEYTKYHFSTEEQLLKMAGYGHYDAHHASHETFVKKISELHRAYANQADEKPLTAKLLSDTLSKWVERHILKEDKEYSAALVKAFSTHRK
jgi:hemerythrin